MAEPTRLGITQDESNNSESLSVFSVLCVFISLVTILADITTVTLVFAEYCHIYYYYLAAATLLLIILPNILINSFSMRWLVMDQKASLQHWITHGFLFGLLERYITFLHQVFWCKNFLEPSKNSLFLVQRNDLNLLHFLYVFTGTVPQILLQSYVTITLEGNYYTRVFSLCASIASVCWACIMYIHCFTIDSDHFKWLSVLIKSMWYFGMLVARLAAILLFSIIFGMWILIPLGLHWAAMTLWIVTQKTKFCPNKLEETLYNIVMGFIYCFCYINLRGGHTRYRLMMFYTLMISQNFGSLLFYVLISDIESQRKVWSIAFTVCIVAGTIIGICSMLSYYRWFHAKGPIFWKTVDEDIELNNKVIPKQGQKDKPSLHPVRSFKTLQKDKPICEDSRKSISETIQQTEIETTDKKFLLDHWIARAGTPTFVSVPIGNISMDSSGIEFYTVENTPQSNYSALAENSVNWPSSKSRVKVKKKLSSLENMDSPLDTSNKLNIQKRRAICSSDELREEFDIHLENKDLCKEGYKIKIGHSSEASQETDSSNKKTSSDSIDMDLDLSFSDINSSDINTFNENIVQKLCLSALKNIKVGNQDADIENIQRIALDILKEMYAKKGKHKSSNAEISAASKRDLDTPTELLSVHDYENICAVNIAREVWGLRSWNGYSDIENWIHDGSVFRDRRRDTLTSGSSEISSCMSQELKGSMSSPTCASKRTPPYSNVFIKMDNSCQNDYVNTFVCPSTSEDTFLAKPCMVDHKDQLEPIMEELDDLDDLDNPNKGRLNSVSSLVATIDEIRKATVTNSPRNVYHRRELSWDSPQLNSVKLESNLKKALWKEPSKFNHSNIMQDLPEKENIFNIHTAKIKHKKENNVPITSTVLNSNINQIRCAKRKQKSINLHPEINTMNNRVDETQSISTNEIDFLWQLVSDNSGVSTSIEDMSQQNQQTSSSLQSLILKDNLTVPIVNVTNKPCNPRKMSRNRPRRKFSILREKFEPKMDRHSDEEVLYHQKEMLNAQLETNESAVVNVKNRFDSISDIPMASPKRKVVSENSRNCASSSKELHLDVPKNIKEKRSQFMKQFLSPPKFNTKLKHKI